MGTIVANVGNPSDSAEWGFPVPLTSCAGPIPGSDEPRTRTVLDPEAHSSILGRTLPDRRYP